MTRFGHPSPELRVVVARLDRASPERAKQRWKLLLGDAENLDVEVFRRSLQQAITDPNFRIFADDEAITVLNNEVFVRGTDIQQIFAQLGVDEPTHAFYLGKELARAGLAVTLGKTYRQEGALSWGYLTPPDDARSEHVRLTQRQRGRDGDVEG